MYNRICIVTYVYNHICVIAYSSTMYNNTKYPIVDVYQVGKYTESIP